MQLLYLNETMPRQGPDRGRAEARWIAKYGREEAPGVGQVVAGIAAGHPDDETRLGRGTALFDDLSALHSGASKH